MYSINKEAAKNIWIHAQGLDRVKAFGESGPKAVTKAIAHLSYVQIDTINVIERCHHHILYNRLPRYKAHHLHLAQSTQKSVFEYWTHALAYLPVEDYRFYIHKMNQYKKERTYWFSSVT